MKSSTAEEGSTLVLGAGELGMSVLRSLTNEAHIGRVGVLTRPSSGESPERGKQKNMEELRSLGVSFVTGDLAFSSVDELAEVMRPYETVISCTGFVGGSGTQRRIAEAVLLARVKRFVPWQFGVDYDVIGRGSAQDLFDEQLDVRDLLRSQTKTQWVIVSTGMFTSFLFEPSFGVFDLQQNVVRALGSWENSVTITTAEDIGALTVKVLAAEPPITNQVVLTAGDTLTYRQAADIVDQVLGRELQREVWTIPYLQEQLAQEPNSQIAKYRVVFAEGRGVSWPCDQTFNEQQGIPVTTVQSWLNEHFA